MAPRADSCKNILLLLWLNGPCFVSSTRPPQNCWPTAVAAGTLVAWPSDVSRSSMALMLLIDRAVDMARRLGVMLPFQRTWVSFPESSSSRSHLPGALAAGDPAPSSGLCGYLYVLCVQAHTHTQFKGKFCYCFWGLCCCCCFAKLFVVVLVGWFGILLLLLLLLLFLFWDRMTWLSWK